MTNQVCHGVALLSGTLLLCSTAFADGVSEPPVDVRIGIVAFGDFGKELQRCEQLFSGLSSQLPIRLQVAIGTYGDLLHWMDRGHIDIGVLTPGVFAKTLTRRNGRPHRYSYVVTSARQAASAPARLW